MDHRVCDDALSDGAAEQVVIVEVEVGTAGSEVEWAQPGKVGPGRASPATLRRWPQSPQPTHYLLTTHQFSLTATFTPTFMNLIWYQSMRL